VADPGPTQRTAIVWHRFRYVLTHKDCTSTRKEGGTMKAIRSGMPGVDLS